jgi:hypothetical protein
MVERPKGYMGVSVTIALSVVPEEKHIAQVRSAAHELTDDPKNVQVDCPTTSPNLIRARFSVPDARQADLVDRIARQFWNVDDYNDSSIGFSRRAAGSRRTRGSSQ